MKNIVVVKSNRKTFFNYFIDWLAHMVCYALVLITLSLIFKKTIQIDNSYFGFWALTASIIIYILNKTIKPLLVWLTLPITALTLGIFYPFINVFILKIVSWILDSHFTINGLIMSFIVAILISIMNATIDNIIEENLKEG